MLQALLLVPAKILLSVAGALFALNFATYATMKYSQQDNEILAITESGPRCGTDDIHIHSFESAATSKHLLHEKARLEVEKARLVTLRGIMHDSEIDVQIGELRSRLDELRLREDELVSEIRIMRYQ